MSCGSEIEANRLFKALMDGQDFNIPIPDFTGPEWQIPGGINNPIYQQVQRVEVEEVTTGTLNGTGAFDKFMAAMRANLQAEFEKGRITGADYTKAYIAMFDSTMNNAVQFALQKDQTYWQAVLGQIQAITGKVALVNATIESSRLQLEALTSQASYALTKLRLSTEDVAYCTSKYNLESILPLNKVGLEYQNQQAQYTLSSLMPQQLKLLVEQTEVQRSQTLDVRTDGQLVVGTVGKQKDLYAQQITSYQRDAEVKAARMFSDTWITQKTIDEGLTAPAVFANPSLETIFTNIKTKNGLD